MRCHCSTADQPRRDKTGIVRTDTYEREPEVAELLPEQFNVFAEETPQKQGIYWVLS